MKLGLVGSEMCIRDRHYFVAAVWISAHFLVRRSRQRRHSASLALWLTIQPSQFRWHSILRLHRQLQLCSTLSTLLCAAVWISAHFLVRRSRRRRHSASLALWLAIQPSQFRLAFDTAAASTLQLCSTLSTLLCCGCVDFSTLLCAALTATPTQCLARALVSHSTIAVPLGIRYCGCIDAAVVLPTSDTVVLATPDTVVLPTSDTVPRLRSG